MVEVIRLWFGLDFVMHRVELGFDFGVLDESISIMVEIVEELVNLFLVEVFDVVRRNARMRPDDLCPGAVLGALGRGLFGWVGVGRADDGEFALLGVSLVGMPLCRQMRRGHGVMARLRVSGRVSAASISK